MRDRLRAALTDALRARDAADDYARAGRPDRAALLREEARVLERHLDAPPS